MDEDEMIYFLCDDTDNQNLEVPPLSEEAEKRILAIIEKFKRMDEEK